jgi:hypothetical protein
MQLLLFLIFLFLFPWFFLLLILIFFVLLPLGFSIQSFLWILAKPAQLFRIITSRRVRKNHAISHGTIRVLEEEYGSLNIEGMPVEEGFSLRGAIDPEMALEAAQTALRRMRGGDESLAFYHRCGITVLLSNTFLAFLLFFLFRMLGLFSMLSAIIALAAVYFIGPRLSMLFQYYGTVSADIGDLDIVGVDVKSEKIAFGGLSMLAPTSVFIRTKRRGEPVIAEVVSP